MSRKNQDVVPKEPLQHTKPINQVLKIYDNVPKATPEQLRIAQIYNEDDPALKGKVQEVQELTGCSEEHAVMALHDCEYEVEGAINLIYEKESGLAGEQNEWQVSTKKHSKKFIPASDNIPSSGESNLKANPLGVTDEMGDGEINKPVNASRGRRRGGGNSGESRHRRDKKEKYSNTKSVNNGDVIDQHDNKANNFEEHVEQDSIQNRQTEHNPSRRGRRTDERWSSSRGRGSSRSDRGFSSQREGNYSGRGSWRKNDSVKSGSNRSGRGGRLVVSNRDDGMKKWQQEEDYRTNNRSNDPTDVMEIDTWNNSQANMNRPEPEGWDDSGDLEGEWKGDSLIVTNSAAVSCLDSTSKLLKEDAGKKFDHHVGLRSHVKKSPEGASSDTKSARDAYNRMATESIKNAIGLKRQDLGSRQSANDQTYQSDSQHQNQDPYNVILGQRHSRSKPPPPSTHIPEAPIQLAPTLQSIPGSVNCQFDFGTGSFISDMKSSASVDPSSIVSQSCNPNLLSTKMDRKHQESSLIPDAPVPIPQRSSPGDRIHRSGGLCDVVSTASLDIGIQSNLVQNVPSTSANQSAQHGQSKIFDSTTSVTSHHHPSTQQSSISSSSANAFNSNFQTSQNTGSSNANKVPQSQSPFSSPLKPVSISSGSGTNYDSNSQSMFTAGSYQSHYSSNADNLQSESVQSNEPSSSNMPQASYASHPKNLSQQQQQPLISNQMHQLKNSNMSSNPSNVPNSSNNAIQHMPPGIPPPMVTPHGLPFPYLNFPYDYETLAAQQRLMFELQQQHNLAAPSNNSDLSNATGALKSSGSMQRSDVQSPPSTTASQTNSTGHQLPQQGNLGAPTALTMPFNLYYLAAAAANQPNQFYQQFIPSSAALGSLFHQTATQNAGQSHLNSTIPAQQYPPQPAKPLSAFNNFGSLHDEIDQMGKFSGPGGLNKSGYGGVKQQSSGPGYHSTSMQQQTHQNEMKAGNSLNSNANSSTGGQVVSGHMPGNAGNSGPTNGNNIPNPGFPSFTLSNNYPNLPPHMFPNNAAAGGSPPAFMAMPGVSAANPGLMHHGQVDSGNQRMVNTGSSAGSKQPMKNYPFWNS